MSRPPKDWPKDPPKDWPKDRPKDLIKDVAKDPGFEPGKSLVADLPPKSIFDPPKSFMEPPIDFPFGGGPFLPGGGGGQLPFVLATGAGAGAGARPQASALADAYVQLLTQYARLHAAGLLDAAGLAAWQEAAAAYQRIVAGV